MLKGKKMELKGSVTSSIRDGKVILEIQDKKSSITFLELTLDGNDFLRMLNGLAFVEADLVMRGVEKVGRVHEHKHFVFEYTEEWNRFRNGDFHKMLYDLGTKLINEQYPGEGWQLDSYFNSQKSLFQKEGKHFARAIARRWVESL